MRNNHNRIRAVSGVLIVSAAALYTRYSPESDFILSPGFDSASDIGFIHVEENQIDDFSCEGKRYSINKTPNHTGTLTDNFEDSIIKIKVIVDSENSDPFIIIKSPDKQRDPICKNNPTGAIEELEIFRSEKTSEQTLHSSDYSSNIEAGSYHVWIGDGEPNEKSVKYTLEIEEEDF